MTLRDHFRPPLAHQRHWHSFHNTWAGNIAAQLNECLPEGYFAESNVQFGIGIDVATFDAHGNGHAAVESSWTPPAPTLTLPMPATTDIVEVAIFHQEGGPTLAGAIELVSPSNKDRPAHRAALVQKCATYLREGIGLALVDVVTARSANLYRELVAAVTQAPAEEGEDALFAAAFRPVQRGEEQEVDIWHAALEIGAPLPTLPLWLRGEICVRLDLDAAYERTCREQRLT